MKNSSASTLRMNERLIITHIGNIGAREKITNQVKVGFVECFLQHKILSSACVRTKSIIKKKKHASCFLIIDNAGSHYLKSLSRDGSVSSRDRNIEILAAEMFKLNLKSEAH